MMEEERAEEQVSQTKKVTPMQLREQYDLKTADLAWKANVTPRVVYFMLLGHPVTRQEAERVLAAISKIAEQTYTLENVQVVLAPEEQQGDLPNAASAGAQEKMNIAILAWGSLIWEPGSLALASTWELSGPAVPLEFSRVSISRSGALTLVIDPVNGVALPTYFALSAFHTLDEAIENLGEREGGGRSCVGYVDCRNAAWYSRHLPSIVGGIAEWGKSNGLDAVVWTDLDSNFAIIDTTQFSDVDAPTMVFSIAHAKLYLHGLRDPGDALARAYINKAPAHIETPLRQSLASDPWLVVASAEAGRSPAAGTADEPTIDQGTTAHEDSSTSDA